MEELVSQLKKIGVDHFLLEQMTQITKYENVVLLPFSIWQILLWKLLFPMAVVSYKLLLNFFFSSFHLFKKIT